MSTTAPGSNGRAMMLAKLFLEGSAKPGRAVHIAGEHGTTTAALKTITSNELRVPIGEIAESGHIKPTGTSIVQRGGFSNQFLHLPDYPWSHEVLTEIMTDMAAGVPNSVRIKSGLRQQHDSGRFEG